MKITIALSCLLIVAIEAFSLKSKLKTKTASQNRMQVAEEYLNTLKQFNNKYDTGKINKIPNFLL